MNKLICVLLTLTITSCSATKEEIALETKKLEIIQAVAMQPTLTCTEGCTYIDPKRNLQLFPKETNGWDFANKLLDTGIAVAPWIAVSRIAIDGMNNAGGNTTNTDSYNTHSESNQANTATNTTTNNTETVSGTKVAGNYNASTTDNNSVNNSYNTDDNSTIDSNDSAVDSNDNNSDNSSVDVIKDEPEVIL